MLKNILLTIVVAVLYYLTGRISLELLSGNSIINIGIFAPEGIALAFAIYYGKKTIPGIFLGQFVLAYITTAVLLPSLEVSLINSLEALIGIYLFEKLKLSKELKTFRDILWLGAIIVFVLQPFSSVLSNTVLLLHEQTQQSDFLYLVFSWWFGNVIGQFLFTPFLLLLFSRYKSIKLLEYIAYGFGFALYLYILEIVIGLQNASITMTLSISGIILIAAYKDILYATYFSIIAAFIASFSVYMGTGVYSHSDTINNAINYNLYVLAHIVIVWLLGILFEERKNNEKLLEQKVMQEVQKNKEQQLLMLHQNRLAQMGELISMIAHQWRQPLNNMALITQLIVNKYNKNKLDDKAFEYFKTNSKKQIDLMSKTIDDFRNFFEVQHEQHNFSLRNTIKNSLDISKPIFEKSNINLELEIDSNIVVNGYENSFAQVLLNILNNAKDALMEKDIEDKKIIIKIDKNEDGVVVSIEDNAGGIDEEIIDKIFDPYFSTKKDKNGTGLGLYMSKMIIEEQMDAKLRVTNTELGAKFTILMKGLDYGN